MKVDPPGVLAHSWLLLVHQLPAKPAYLRVKIWRRLQDIGAVAVKNAVHALPMNEETQEDYEWLLREIREGGGEAFVCEARLIDGLSDEEVRALFDRARDVDYAELAKEAQVIAKALRRKANTEAATELRAQVARLRKRLAEIAAIDFFGAIGRETAEELLGGLEAQLDKDEPVASKTTTEPNLIEKLRNRTWVTREGVYADRIASAWLIRRFIDPEGTLIWMEKNGECPPGAVGFGYEGAPFANTKSLVTFEQLLQSFGLNKNKTLARLGALVHCLEAGGTPVPEAAGVETLLQGAKRRSKTDGELFSESEKTFDLIYEAYSE